MKVMNSAEQARGLHARIWGSRGGRTSPRCAVRAGLAKELSLEEPRRDQGFHRDSRTAIGRPINKVCRWQGSGESLQRTLGFGRRWQNRTNRGGAPSS